MPRVSTRRPLDLALLTATMLAVAWGALAFGAVYPWAYTTLALVCTAVSLVALASKRRGRPPLGAMATAFSVVAVAIVLQLAPLPTATLERLSPRAGEFLSRYDLSYGLVRPAGGNDLPAQQRHAPNALSILPRQTVVGLSLFLTVALFLLGTTRLLSATGARPIVRPLIAFGILLSVVGIGQFALTAYQEHPLIYGFWKPTFDSRPFGPFVNPNHFAGWMLMVLPLGLALFYESLQRTMEAAAQRTRNMLSVTRLPEFGRTLTFGFASLVMGLSLLMTRSRSGVAALAAGSLIALWITLRRQRSMKARAIVIVAFLVVVGGAGAWAGLDTLVEKAAADNTNDSLGGRLGAWKDTLHIIRDFPLTGTGFNTYGTAMTVYQTFRPDLHFQEAHNDYLQIAAEGGLLLGIPVLVAVGVFIRDVRRRFREAPKEGTTYWLRVGAVIGLVCIGLQSLVEFSLQMPGNAALFAVIAAIALHQSPNLRRAAARAKRHDTGVVRTFPPPQDR